MGWPRGVPINPLVPPTVTQAEEVTDPCQGGPASWCRDVATAVRCQKEQQCRQLWDSLGTVRTSPGPWGSPPLGHGVGWDCGGTPGTTLRVRVVPAVG